MQLFEKAVHFKEPRDEVSLPWKNENNDLFSNYNVAKRHFEQRIKKFQTNVPLYNQHSDIILEYVSQDTLEHVENTVTNNRKYHLPHRAVIKKELSYKAQSRV